MPYTRSIVLLISIELSAEEILNFFDLDFVVGIGDGGHGHEKL